jgi:hypothetical protein
MSYSALRAVALSALLEKLAKNRERGRKRREIERKRN